MYTLIYDDHKLDQIKKKVISVHETRKKSEEVLTKRQTDLGRRVYECNTRIVWTDKEVSTDDVLEANEFATWRPGEDIPVGELNSDSD